jgi:hypothetical protein
VLKTLDVSCVAAIIRAAYGTNGKDREAAMTIVCSCCQRYLGTQPPFHDKAVSHGLCTPCTIRQNRELRTLVLSRERADKLPMLSSLFRAADCYLVIDRRSTDRRQSVLEVDVCRRAAKDRRLRQSLRLV